VGFFFPSLRPTGKLKLRDWFSVVFLFFGVGRWKKGKIPTAHCVLTPRQTPVRSASKEEKKMENQKNGKVV
jgi:hypothetical protein